MKAALVLLCLLATPALADPAPSVCLTLDELNRVVAAQVSAARAQDGARMAADVVAKVQAAFAPPKPEAPLPPKPEAPAAPPASAPEAGK